MDRWNMTVRSAAAEVAGAWSNTGISYRDFTYGERGGGGGQIRCDGECDRDQGPDYARGKWRCWRTRATKVRGACTRGWEIPGISLSFLVNTLNLPLYVIGGGVASSWHLFAPKMFEVLTRDSYVYRLTAAQGQMDMDPLRTSVVPALLGPESGLLGAAMLPFAELEDLAKSS